MGSCTNNVRYTPVTTKKDRVTVSMVADTVIQIPNYGFAPRYDCRGRRLNQPKVVAVGQNAIPIRLKRQLSLDRDSLFGESKDSTAVVIPAKRQASSDIDAPDWFNDVLWVLLALILIGLAVCFLWKLFKRSGSNPSATFVGNAKPVSDSYQKTEKTNSPAPTQSSDKVSEKEFAGIVSVVHSLQKSHTGGIVQYGNMTVTIPSSIPPITVHADRGGRINNVTVHVETFVDTMSVSADMLDLHEGNDNRQYSRNAGDKADKKS